MFVDQVCMKDWFNTGSIPQVDGTQTRGFCVADQTMQAAFFVVYRHEGILVYQNVCPHTGAPLEWVPDQFLDASGHYIQCAMHGALFRMSDGFCLQGPCVGQCLTPLPTKICEGELWVKLV